MSWLKEWRDWLQGIPVITTATDINGIFAVDVFAARSEPLYNRQKRGQRNFCLAAGWREGGIFLRFGVPRGGEGVWSRALKKQEFRQRDRERWVWY
ncbi:MAG: hypothetical protein ACLTW9_00285 [Enterocloster sp.]